MDIGLTIAFTVSLFVSAIFVAIAIKGVIAIFSKSTDDFVVVTKKNRRLHPLDNELLEFEQKGMEKELSQEEEFKKAA